MFIMYSLLISLAIYLLLQLIEASISLPLPANGIYTKSPSSVADSMILCPIFTGFSALILHLPVLFHPISNMSFHTLDSLNPLPVSLNRFLLAFEVPAWSEYITLNL